MKKTILLAASLLALNLTPVFGQPAPILPPKPITPASTPQLQPRSYQPPGSPFSVDPYANANVPTLTKFNLDFPGGTPKELVAAIEKAMGKPLNVIIPEEDAATKLPPVKLSDMDVGKLFKTLSENGLKYADNRGNSVIVRNYGFKTIDYTPSDNSLWTFYSYTKPGQQTQFSLDFPGGAPVQLVKAIEKAMNKRINVIINKDDENVELPPLKMDDVFLPQLFTALEVASRKTVAVSSPGFPGSYQQVTTSYGFKSADDMSDAAVWYFHIEKPSLPPVVSTLKICQFYSLAPYLDRGFTVDDITTAIQTGWKMAGVTPTPDLNYHKETKLLIAFGEPDKLKTIQNVLQTLPTSNATRNELDKLEKGMDKLTDIVSTLQGEVARHDVKLNQIPVSAPSASKMPEEKSGK